MRRLIIILVLSFTINCFSQAITVSTNSYTVPELVNNVLINSPCVSATNVTWKTGTDFSSSNGIGFFQNTNPNFPMNAGVVLTTGNANRAAGPNTIHLNDGSVSWPGDSDLQSTLAAAGIPMNSINATVLEFDFIPISPEFGFDFLFASEEYGNFQCEFSDAFAFLLTNTATGVTKNLAVVPGTDLPISVVTIRNFLYNSSCPSANSQYFGNYNGGSAAAGSATNYNGQTKRLNASDNLTPGVLYHIKLVVADRTDYESDSAIFIASDSFNIGQYVLGLDRTVATKTAICPGTTHVIHSALDPAVYSFVWKRNGVAIAGKTGPTLNVTQPGNYTLIYQLIGSCQPVSDTVTIEFYPELVTQNPINLYKCIGSGNTYDLSINTPIVKTGSDPTMVVTYHASMIDAANDITLPLNYAGMPNQTLYVKIKSADTPCYVIKTFVLLSTPAPVANQPQDLTKCARSASLNNAIFNFTPQTPVILNGQSSTLFKVTYHQTQADANTGANVLDNREIGTNNMVIYVRVENKSDSTCFSTTSFTLHVTPLPLVDKLPDVTLCKTYYTLPALTNGNYFSQPNGNGIPMFAGDVISETQIIHIYSQPGSPDSCPAVSSFKVTIVDSLTGSHSSVSSCGSYTLPALKYGAYFDGPGGTGTLFPAGTEITTSQMLYFYFQSPTPSSPCIVNSSLYVNILPKVDIGQQENVFACTAYTLPPLPNGGYFTKTNGGGTQIPAGTVITSTQTLYAYAKGGAPNFCKSEKVFTVFIELKTPEDISQCNGYVLPELPIGNYFTQPAGAGDMIAAGTSLEETTTVYIYIPNNGGPNCTDDVHFIVNIAQPLIDHLEDVTVCGGYTLPAIANGTYYTGPEQTGTQLAAGALITSTKTIYIFKRATPTCYNENSFIVRVNPKPAIDSRSDIDACNSYKLTPLNVGNYYTAPGGTGTMFSPGTIITETKTIYIYAISDEGCTAENHFTVTIFSIHADDPDDVVQCDSYTLPPLNVGNYYALPGGPVGAPGSLMHAGDIITASKTIYIYTESGERINCTDENSFNITINHTPVITPINDHNVCNVFVLPPLAIGNYYTGPNKTGALLHEGDEITETKILYIHAETNTTPNCINEESFLVTVFNVDELPDVTSCKSYVLPALTIGKYYTEPNAAGSLLQTGESIYSSGTIYIYANSPFTPVCYDESSFEVTIVPEPLAHTVPIALTTVCDQDGNNDGVTAFNLTDLDAAVLGLQTGPEFTTAYYKTMEDANMQSNPITCTTAQLAFVRVNNTLAANCFDVKPISILVNKIPEPKPVAGVVCYDSETQTLLNPYTIPSGLSTASHTFEWFNEAGDLVGTGSSYTAMLPGKYSIIAINLLTGCVSEETFVTIAPSEPALISFTITDDFADNQIVTVQAIGVGGDYEYQLDFGPWQDSNVFENVSTGMHTVTVRDQNGCGISTSDVLVVNYPKFFTPNNDGFNDTWNIIALKAQATAKISIFDRYGKFLTQIRPNDAGWDGTYNGKVLPATDYWFVVNYEKDGVSKEFKAHFSMKR